MQGAWAFLSDRLGSERGAWVLLSLLFFGLWCQAKRLGRTGRACLLDAVRMTPRLPLLKMLSRRAPGFWS